MGVYPAGTGIKITETFRVGDVETDPTTVEFRVFDPDGSETDYLWGINPEVTHPSTGVFVLTLAPPAMSGLWLYEVEGTGTVVATATGDFTVLPAIGETFDTGPCSSWCDESDVRECCTANGIDAEPCPPLSYAVRAASELLWARSAHLYGGRCVKDDVRPCGIAGCGFQILSRGYIVWPTDPWNWGWDGMRWNIPDFRGCGCTPVDSIKLDGYPVREILEVKIDGAVIPETDNWRLDKRRFLTRIADADGNAQFWPACQRMDLANTEVGTFSVSYAYGADPPLLGRQAAAQLACEIFKACAGATCALPAGATRQVRQGVTIDYLASLSWLKANDGTGVRTGLTLVDAFLNGFNPAGLTQRPVIATPGMRDFPQKVGS